MLGEGGRVLISEVIPVCVAYRCILRNDEIRSPMLIEEQPFECLTWKIPLYTLEPAGARDAAHLATVGQCLGSKEGPQGGGCFL